MFLCKRFYGCQPTLDQTFIGMHVLKTCLHQLILDHNSSHVKHTLAKVRFHTLERGGGCESIRRTSMAFKLCDCHAFNVYGTPPPCKLVPSQLYIINALTNLSSNESLKLSPWPLLSHSVRSPQTQLAAIAHLQWHMYHLCFSKPQPRKPLAAYSAQPSVVPLHSCFGSPVHAPCQGSTRAVVAKTLNLKGAGHLWQQHRKF